ncbi:unnamed protein product, partial [Phaeothamnion confervicola]
MTPAARNAVAVICALVGGAIVALAAGIIPADESAFHAPHWVIGACGFVFMIAGFLVVVPETMSRMKNFLAAVMLSLFAAIPGWIAFGSGPRVFGGSISFGAMTSATHPGEMVGRIAFGFGAVLLGLCAAYVWWKWLR